MAAQRRNKLVLLLQTKRCDLERLYFCWDNNSISESSLGVNSNYLSGATRPHWSQTLRNKVLAQGVLNAPWKCLSLLLMPWIYLRLLSCYRKNNKKIVWVLKIKTNSPRVSANPSRHQQSQRLPNMNLLKRRSSSRSSKHLPRGRERHIFDFHILYDSIIHTLQNCFQLT